MSVMIERGGQLLGVPLVKVRNVLSAWRYGTKDAWAIAARTDVGLSQPTVALLIDEMRLRGLIGQEAREYGPPIDGLTEAGRALLAAKGRRRAPKQKAQAVFDRLLEASVRINAREDLPFRMDKIWLLGSMIDDGKTDVGDIDFVPIYSRRPPYDEDDVARERVIDELSEELGVPLLGGIKGILYDEQRVLARLLYGERRHPYLAAMSVEELRMLGRPCRLAFDRSRGGIVDDPVLPQHPESPGRSNRMGAPATMPDLSPPGGLLEPLDARSTLPRSERPWWEFTARPPWPDAEKIYEFTRDHGNGSPKIALADEPIPRLLPNALTKRFDVSDCDGRSRVGFFTTQDCGPPDGYDPTPNLRAQIGIVLERRIEEGAGGIRYVVDLARSDVLKGSYNYADILLLEWSVHALMMADAERIARREVEGGSGRAITIDVVASGGNIGELMVDNLRASIPALLARVHEAAGLPEPEPAAVDAPSVHAPIP